MTKHRKTRLDRILWVVSHSSSPFKNHAWRLFLNLFTLLAFFYKRSFCSLLGDPERCESGPKASEPHSTSAHSPPAYCCFSANATAETGGPASPSRTRPIWYKHR